MITSKKLFLLSLVVLGGFYVGFLLLNNYNTHIGAKDGAEYWISSENWTEIVPLNKTGSSADSWDDGFCYISRSWSGEEQAEWFLKEEVSCGEISVKEQPGVVIKPFMEEFDNKVKLPSLEFYPYGFYKAMKKCVEDEKKE